MARLSGRIEIIAVGKLRAGHWRAAQEEYLRRLDRYTTIGLKEVRDFVGSGPPDVLAAQREGQLLLKAAGDARRKIALSHTGKRMSSPQLAKFLRKQIDLYGHLAFLIGGPAGLSKDVMETCDTHLSLSLLTFPHELARVILLEQLYRAATILGGERYHK